MKVRIRPSRLKGCVRAPASKSMAHRFLIAAALSDGVSVLRGTEINEDVQATIDCLRLLGARIEEQDGTLYVQSHGLSLPEDVIFPLRESGSTFRFLVPVTLMIGGKARFQGSERLMERGIRVYEDLFREKGIRVIHETDPAGALRTEKDAENKGISLLVEGQLRPGVYRLPGGFSSQFISGLLFALPCLTGDSRIEIIPPVESNPYIGLTMDTLRRFGVETARENETLIHVAGGQHFHPADLMLEGDWTNGAVLLALRSLGHEVSVEGLDPKSHQGDRAFLDFEKELKKEAFSQIDLRDTPDLAPVLFVLASVWNGAVFTGIERLRLKESDRLTAMAEELRKFGVEIETHEHSVVILPSLLHAPLETLKSHNDHRVVMALALLMSIYGGEIDGAEAVRKSFPGFFDVLKELGAIIAAG